MASAGRAARCGCSPANGRVVSLPISGQGRNLTGAQIVAQDGFVTLYATAQTVAALSGTPGYTRLAFRLRDHSIAAAHRTVTAIRQYLQTVPGFTGFSDLPEIRAPGDWPGKSRFNNITSILYVVTLLALLGALVLLSSTMSDADRRADAGDRDDEGNRRRTQADPASCTCGPPCCSARSARSPARCSGSCSRGR